MIKRLKAIFIFNIIIMIFYLSFMAIIINYKDEQEKELYYRLQQLEVLQSEVVSLRNEQESLNNQIVKFMNKWNVEVFEATSYSPSDDKNGLNSDSTPSITATGTTPKKGTVAVNPKVIPYGSQMWIQGYGQAKAEDTGGTIRSRDDLIDLYQPTFEEAIRWGRKKVVVVWNKES